VTDTVVTIGFGGTAAEGTDNVAGVALTTMQQARPERGAPRKHPMRPNPAKCASVCTSAATKRPADQSPPSQTNPGKTASREPLRGPGMRGGTEGERGGWNRYV